MSQLPNPPVMSRAELEDFIRTIVQQELTHSPQARPYKSGQNIPEVQPAYYEMGQNTPEAQQNILNGLIRQENVPSPTQMLREDRDR